jgi:hypothetical protein
MDDNRFVLGVDLDGVCAEFIGALRRLLPNDWGFELMNSLKR